MSFRPVEWVLVIRYGLSAHRATYGRLAGSTYTKDYIQLHKTAEFVSDLEAAFPQLAMGVASIPIEFNWPAGSSNGAIFRRSADRPHLAWQTRGGAPAPWKMTKDPTPSSVETIRGDPTHSNAGKADREYQRLVSSGFGQPYLVAVKLRDEANTLHLRVHIANPEEEFAWADLQGAPTIINELAASTSDRSALTWRLFDASSRLPSLYFDSRRKFGFWKTSRRPLGRDAPGSTSAVEPGDLDSDMVAENLAYSDQEVEKFARDLDNGNFSVPDTFSTTKTRGSAQKVFADRVKKAYGWKCALTGISTRQFLVASHIVPWGLDETIRLDPSNGICFSVLVDRAFEHGFLRIEDDLVVKLDWAKIASDAELESQLRGYDGARLRPPKMYRPNVEYLRRKRGL